MVRCGMMRCDAARWPPATSVRYRRRYRLVTAGAGLRFADAAEGTAAGPAPFTGDTGYWGNHPQGERCHPPHDRVDAQPNRR